jgi:VIT1/CCC1 family predicted Fe2+/Mn2+ transporter
MTARARGHSAEFFLGATVKEPESAGGAMMGWLVVVVAVVIVAAGLFGYDQGVISGALPGIKAAGATTAGVVTVAALVVFIIQKLSTQRP